MAREHTVRIVRWAITTAALFGAALALFFLLRNHAPALTLSIQGAVITESTDPRNQSPIESVVVSAANGAAVSAVKTDFAGGFTLVLRRPALVTNSPVTLTFRHPDYRPIDVTVPASGQLNVIRMVPIHGETAEQTQAPLNQNGIVIGDVQIRYSIMTDMTDNIGSGVKTFQAPNTGNVPCDKHPPCSPDGKWKATDGSASLDAGEGNVFRNARVICIAGPCPFTKVDSGGLSEGQRNIKVKVRNWSDTTTFLLQAEVYQQHVGDIVRTSYPVIFGRSMNFTLPASAEGPSVDAELNGVPLVVALGPSPMMSWADCNVRVEKSQAKDYRCQLKAGYRFK